MKDLRIRYSGSELLSGDCMFVVAVVMLVPGGRITRAGSATSVSVFATTAALVPPVKKR